MSMIDDALIANKRYAQDFDRESVKPPRPKLAVLTCMDPRLSDLEAILGLTREDMHVMRNVGPALTEDALRSLIVSTRVIGTKEILILAHTRCGLSTLQEEEFEAKLKDETGTAGALASVFFSYTDVQENTRAQIGTVRCHPWIPKDVPVRGVVYDIDTGLLNEIDVGPQQGNSSHRRDWNSFRLSS
jgi:carbonic anhydrase